MVEVVLHLHVGLIDGLDDAPGFLAAGVQVARHVHGVEGFEQQRDAVPGGFGGGAPEVGDEGGFAIAPLRPFRHDAGHNVDHAGAKPGRVFERLLEVLAKASFSSGHGAKAPLASFRISRKGVEEDHGDAGIVDPAPHFGHGIGIGRQVFNGLEPRLAGGGEALRHRKLAEHHRYIGGEFRQRRVPWIWRADSVPQGLGLAEKPLIKSGFLWSSHPAQDAVSLTRKEHGIGPASAWAAGEAFRGEGILPSHAPQGAVLHMPVRRSARLSARGRAECPPPEGTDSEPKHQSINASRDFFHGREGILPSLCAEGASLPILGQPAQRHEGRMPSLQKPVRHWRARLPTSSLFRQTARP